MKGKLFGYWTVIGNKKERIGKYIYIKCVCKCGTKRNVRCQNLNSGISTSCGCVGRAKTVKRNIKHNLRFSKAWSIWNGMKQRCNNPKNRAYKNYGARGIKVCLEWQNDFMAFYSVVGDPPKGRSIDRIDNNGNYEPSNVRWATRAEQSRNRRTTNLIGGVCELDISEKLGGSSGLVQKRLKRGWSLERAISEKTYANS